MNLFKLLGTIAVDNSEANKAIEDTSTKAESSGKKTESAFSKIGTAAMGIGKAVVGVGAALGTAMKANPIGLVISLIMGLVAAFIYLWKNNEDFRAFWIKLWEKIKSTAGDATKWIKNKFNDLKDAVGNVKKRFDEIKNAISDRINDAKDSVKKAIDKIKGFFPLSIGKIFSNLKIPKIIVSGGKAPFGIAGKGKLPSFDVKWNAEGGVFDEPTLLPSLKGWQGVGEAGAEAIAPITVLQDYVRKAVKEENNGLVRTLIEQNQILMDFLTRAIPNTVRLDSGELVGALTPSIDVQLSDRWQHSKRGNTR